MLSSRSSLAGPARLGSFLLVLAFLPACEDAAGGGTGGGGGAGGASPGETVGWPTTVGAGTETARRTASEICSTACACDATCAQAPEANVAACEARFQSDAEAAATAGCAAEHDAYFLCFSNDWTCAATQACDDVAEAFGACVARICEEADALCGCPGCSGECRSVEQRCYARCIVEAGSCGGESDAYWACVEGCYQGDDGDEATVSVGSGGFGG